MAATNVTFPIRTARRLGWWCERFQCHAPNAIAGSVIARPSTRCPRNIQR